MARQRNRRYPNIVPGPKGLTGSRKQTYTWMVFLNAMRKMWGSFVTALRPYCNLDLCFKLQEIEEEIHWGPYYTPCHISVKSMRTKIEMDPEIHRGLCVHIRSDMHWKLEEPEGNRRWGSWRTYSRYSFLDIYWRRKEIEGNEPWCPQRTYCLYPSLGKAAFCRHESSISANSIYHEENQQEKIKICES